MSLRRSISSLWIEIVSKTRRGLGCWAVILPCAWLGRSDDYIGEFHLHLHLTFRSSTKHNVSHSSISSDRNCGKLGLRVWTSLRGVEGRVHLKSSHKRCARRAKVGHKVKYYSTRSFQGLRFEHSLQPLQILHIF